MAPTADVPTQDQDQDQELVTPSSLAAQFRSSASFSALRSALLDSFLASVGFSCSLLALALDH